MSESTISQSETDQTAHAISLAYLLQIAAIKIESDYGITNDALSGGLGDLIKLLEETSN